MKFNSLRARLIVPTLSLSALVMLAAAAAGSTLVMRHLNAGFGEQAARTVEFVAKVGTPYVTNYDLTALGSFIKELSRDKRVAYAEFFDAEGKSLTSDVSASPADTSGMLLIEREVQDASGKTVGRLKTGFRNDAALVARNLVLGSF